MIMENNIYEEMQVPVWDDYIPDVDHQADFQPDDIVQQITSFDEMVAQEAIQMPQIPTQQAAADAPAPLEGEEKAVVLYNQVIAHAVYIKSEIDGIWYLRDTLNNSPEIRIKRMENGISIKNQTKASKQEGNHGLFHLKRA